MFDPSMDLAPNVEQVAVEINATYGVAATSAQVDIVDFATVQTACGSYLQSGRQLDHVVHCAAAGSGKFGFPFTNLSPGDWPRILEINILGMVNVAHAISPHFVDRKAGTFVFLSSVAGQIGSQTDPPYSTQARRPTSTSRSAWPRIWRSMESVSTRFVPGWFRLR